VNATGWTPLMIANGVSYTNTLAVSPETAATYVRFWCKRASGAASAKRNTHRYWCKASCECQEPVSVNVRAGDYNKRTDQRLP
jgi:hypothetical protein